MAARGARAVLGRIPRSHVKLGTIDLPVNMLSIHVGFVVRNEGNAPGLLAVKMNVTHQKFGGDDTWFRYTPLLDDDVAKGPNIITDKLFTDTGGRFRARMAFPVPPTYAPQAVKPGEEKTVLSVITIPGAAAGQEVRDWWLDDPDGSTMKIDAWLWHVTPEGVGLKMIEYHKYQDAFKFGSVFATTAQMVVVGSGLAVTSG